MATPAGFGSHRIVAFVATSKPAEAMGQDDDAIWTSPSGARVAWFKDPDGNTLSITEFGE